MVNPWQSRPKRSNCPGGQAARSYIPYNMRSKKNFISFYHLVRRTAQDTGYVWLYGKSLGWLLTDRPIFIDSEILLILFANI